MHVAPVSVHRFIGSKCVAAAGLVQTIDRLSGKPNAVGSVASDRCQFENGRLFNLSKLVESSRGIEQNQLGRVGISRRLRQTKGSRRIASLVRARGRTTGNRCARR